MSRTSGRPVSAGSGRVIQGGTLGATYTLALNGDKDVWLVATLGANLTLTLSGLSAGARVKLLLDQDATGGRTLTLSDGTSTQAVTVPSVPLAVSVLTLDSPDGSTIYVEHGSGTGGATISSSAPPATIPPGSEYWQTNAQGAVVAVFVGDASGTPVQTLSPVDLPFYDPSINNLVAANGDPALATSSWNTTSAWLLLCLLEMTKDKTLTQAVSWVNTAGATFSNANRIGLYLPNGALIAQGADQGNATAGLGWGGTGEKRATLTAEAGQTLARTRGEKLIAAFIVNATTSPQFARLTNTGSQVANLGCDGTAAYPYRFASSGSTYTALPATLNGVTVAGTPAAPFVGLN